MSVVAFQKSKGKVLCCPAVPFLPTKKGVPFFPMEIHWASESALDGAIGCGHLHPQGTSHPQPPQHPRTDHPDHPRPSTLTRRLDAPPLGFFSCVYCAGFLAVPGARAQRDPSQEHPGAPSAPSAPGVKWPKSLQAVLCKA